MAKLPEEFVKPPADRAAPKKRNRRTSIVPVERARELLREVVLKLTEDEHRALEEARDELRSAGEELTLEQLVHRVIADWGARRSAQRVETTAPARSVDGILAQLRRLAGSPLRTWRELGVAALRRVSGGRLVQS